MRRLTLVSILATLTAAVSVGAVYVERQRIDYTCTGAYSTDVTLPGIRVTGIVNVVISVSRANRVYTNMEGALSVNGNKYHLSREIAWKYEVTNASAGLMRVTPLYETRSSSDNVVGSEVDSYIIGKEKGGRIIRQWKLNDDVVLVGNPYSPIYSCVIVR